MGIMADKRGILCVHVVCLSMYVCAWCMIYILKMSKMCICTGVFVPEIVCVSASDSVCLYECVCVCVCVMGVGGRDRKWLNECR